ncbi:uncharacterized protein [Misgurnus anguillicaudatus]|uniref:uncharacterized protein n=1 Tax=Misgurnus anguillicaudatus TaxID=75329 RepID=UPI003CCFC789
MTIKGNSVAQPSTSVSEQKKKKERREGSKDREDGRQSQLNLPLHKCSQHQHVRPTSAMLMLCHRRYRLEKGQELRLLLNLPIHKCSQHQGLQLFFQSKKEERDRREDKGSQAPCWCYVTGDKTDEKKGENFASSSIRPVLSGCSCQPLRCRSCRRPLLSRSSTWPVLSWCGPQRISVQLSLSFPSAHGRTFASTARRSQSYPLLWWSRPSASRAVSRSFAGPADGRSVAGPATMFFDK